MHHPTPLPLSSVRLYAGRRVCATTRVCYKNRTGTRNARAEKVLRLETSHPGPFDLMLVRQGEPPLSVMRFPSNQSFFVNAMGLARQHNLRANAQVEHRDYGYFFLSDDQQLRWPQHGTFHFVGTEARTRDAPTNNQPHAFTAAAAANQPSGFLAATNQPHNNPYAFTAATNAHELPVCSNSSVPVTNFAASSNDLPNYLQELTDNLLPSQAPPASGTFDPSPALDVLHPMTGSSALVPATAEGLVPVVGVSAEPTALCTTTTTTTTMCMDDDFGCASHNPGEAFENNPSELVDYDNLSFEDLLDCFFLAEDSRSRFDGSE